MSIHSAISGLIRSMIASVLAPIHSWRTGSKVSRHGLVEHRFKRGAVVGCNRCDRIARRRFGLLDLRKFVRHVVERFAGGVGKDAIGRFRRKCRLGLLNGLEHNVVMRLRDGLRSWRNDGRRGGLFVDFLGQFENFRLGFSQRLNRRLGRGLRIG